MHRRGRQTVRSLLPVKKCIPGKNTMEYSAVVTCECDLFIVSEIELSVEFCLVGGMNNSESRL